MNRYSHEAVEEYLKTAGANTIDFEQWIKMHMASDNKDCLSRFWFQTLYFLNAYYGYFFAIRTGNYALRNACLPVLTELFSAYSHNKYEQLACETLYDNARASKTILSYFIKGEWTLSISGKPFHNVALDEGHEMVINRRLKELTSRPSEYRTVTLANFMAYLDKFMELLQNYVINLCRKKSSTIRKDYEYTEVVLNKLKPTNIFSDRQERSLCNIFHSQPTQLDNETIHDLLNVQTEGNNRMREYINQTFLQTTAKKNNTKRNRKMKHLVRDVLIQGHKNQNLVKPLYF